MEENFLLDLVSYLDQSSSQKQVNKDIKQLEKTINMLRLTATLAKGSSKKEINAYIKMLSNQLSTIKLKAKIDSKNLKSEINSALSKVSFKDIETLNIDGNKTKLKVQKAIADAKAYAEKNPINIGINYENRRNKLDNDLTAYLKRNSKIQESSTLLREADKVRNLIGAINDKKSLREATDAFQLYKSSVASVGFNTKSTTDKIKSMFGHITKLGSLFSVTSLAVNNFTKSLGTLKDIDDILTEISKTSNLTAQELERLGNISFKSASKYGKTASDYLTGIREMSRSGFYGEKGTAMAEQSLLAQAAGDMSADVANKYVLATNAAYKFNGEAEKLNAVLDGQNSITNRNSVALSDMAIAMSEVGTVASSYRVSIEDLSAMIGTMESVTKLGGSEVGNGIKAILINLQNVNSSKITDTLDAANASMTEFVNGTEKLRDPISILRDLAETFNKLDEDDALRAEILTNIGGKHQASKLAALLQNMELFDKMLVDYSEGSGSALEEAMKSANNLSGKINQIQNSWNSLVNSIVNKNSVLSGLTFGDKLIQGAESFIDTFGEIPVLLTTINTAMTAMKKDYGITKVWDKESQKIDIEGKLFGIDISRIKDLKKHYNEAGEAITKWNKELKGGKVDIEAFNNTVVQNSTSLKEYLSTCSKDAPASLKGYRQYLQETGQATEDLRLKTILLNTALTFLGSIAVQAVITEIAEAFDKFNETVEESQEKVDDINSKISDLNAQIEELNSLEYKSDFDNQKIAQLEKELELQEKILEIEQKRLYQNQIGTKFSDYFDKDSLVTKQNAEYDRNNKENYANLSKGYNTYKSSLEDIDSQLASLQEKLNSEDLIGRNRFMIEGEIAKLTEKRNNLLEKQQTIEEQLTLNMREYLTNYQTAQEAVESGLLTGDDLEKARSMAEYWNKMYHDSANIVANIQKMNGTYDNTIDQLEEKFGGISRDELASLSDDDKRIALSFDSDNIIGFEELQQKITETKGDIEELNETEISITPTISSSIQQIATQLEPQFSKLSEAYQEIFKLDDNGKETLSFDAVDNSMLEELRQTFAEIKEEVGVAFDASKLDSFFDTLTNGNSTAEQVQQAFNNLATAYLYSTDTLEQLNSETADSIEKQLEAMGVQNAAEIVADALTAKTEELIVAKEYLAQTGKELTSATEEERNAFILEQIEAGNCGEALALLQLKKLLVNQSTITTAADCQNILALAQAANIGVQQLQQLQTLMNMITQRDAAVQSGDSRAVSELNRAINEFSSNVVSSLNLDDVQVDFGNIGGGASKAGKAGKKVADAYVDAFEDELKKLQTLRDQGKITEKQYLDYLRRLYQKFFKDKKKYSEQYAKYEHEYLQGMKSLYQSALSGITSMLDKQISAYEDSKNAAVESLEAQRDAAIEAKEAEKERYEQEIELIDKKIAAKEKAIQSINDEIDLMRELNSQKDRENKLAKAKYDFERMMNQRTILQYSEDKGISYVQDLSGARDKKQAVEDAELEITIASKEKEIKLIKKEIDLLNEKKVGINENIDLLDKQIDQINQYYDKLISDTEKYWDDLIRDMEDYKSRWEELGKIEEQAKVLETLRALGIETGDILGMSEEAFAKFKDEYIGILADIYSGNDSMLSALSDTTGQSVDEMGSYLNATQGYIDSLSGIGESLNPVSDAIGDVDENMGNLSVTASEANTNLSETATNVGNVSSGVGELKANISEANNLISEEQTAFETLRQTIDNVIEAINQKTQAIQEEQAVAGVATTTEMAYFLLLKEKILEVKESIREINDIVTTLDRQPIDNLTNAFQTLYDQIMLVSATLGAGMEGQGEGAVSSIKSAIESLNEISFEEGIIAQFTNLKTAIDSVTSAISGGGGESSGGEGQGGSSGKGNKAGGNSSEGEVGGGNSLTGAINEMGDTAAEVIGESDAEGDGTVIGEFGSMKTAVNDVTTAIGGGDSESGEGSGGSSEGEGNLISSIVDLGETTQETLGESGGDGVIGRFEELKQPIQEANEHVHSISDGLEEIDGKEVECTIKVNIEVSGGTGFTGAAHVFGSMNLESTEYNAKYTGSAHAEGTALVSGNWAVQSDEQNALVGEVGRELIVRGGRFFTVGDNGAEMFDIKKGDIVFNHEQTESLLKNGHISGRGKAYADGTVGGGKFLGSDGHIYRPLQEGDYGYDLVQKFQPLVDKILSGEEELVTNAVFEGQKQMEQMVKTVTNNTAINNITNNRNMQPVVHQQFNITMPNITDSTSAASLMNDLQSIATKKFQVDW